MSERPIEAKPLGREVRRTLAALAEAVVPEVPGVSSEQIVDRAHEIIAQMPRALALLFPIGVRGFEMSSVLVCGRRFSQLGVTQRAAYVESWIHAPQFSRREIMRGLKGL